MAVRTRKGTDAPAERRNRETEVFDAAVRIFNRKGFSAASVQDVADEVGVLKGSLYYYIDSKEDLLFRILMESHAQASVMLEETAALDVDALERLRAYFERYVRWYLDNVERVSIYFNESRHLTGDRYQEILKQRRRENAFVEGLIDEAKREGYADPKLSTKFATFFVLGAINGLPTWYRRRGGATPAELATAYTHMIIGTITGTHPGETPSSDGVSKRTPAKKRSTASKPTVASKRNSGSKRTPASKR